ncbi:MAG: phytoene desaturase family protein, partial [Chitinophagaceae bacterium]
VFDRYFSLFGKNRADYYQLHRLDPSYRIYWGKEEWNIPANYNELKAFFEKVEPGSSLKLDQFLAEAAYKYEVGINKLVHKPGQSLAEFADADLIKGVFRLDVFNSIKKHIAKLFKSEQLRQLLEFPVLFLGALPENTPALYSLMNYADIKGGTWYPEGGMYSIVKAMHKLAVDLGVNFQFNAAATAINIENKKAKTIAYQNTVNGQLETINADVVIAGADYHFVETQLLPPAFQSYTQKYWDTRVMAPSCLLYYVGLNKKLKNIEHHSLFFDTSFAVHGQEIYTTKKWPVAPLFYMSATSVTDSFVAPQEHENLFLLIPVAAGLTGDTEELREHYFKMMVERIEKQTGQSIKEHIVYKKSYALSNFIEDYHAFKGNAYGLANTLLQTAVLKPACKSKKVANLFYTGQLTVPGPGVPPSLISGEVVAKLINKTM